MSMAPTKVDTIHGVWVWGGFLAVRCIRCNRRAVLQKERHPFIRYGVMKPLSGVKLRCSGCKVAGAGNQYWEMWVPSDQEEANQFLRGYSVRMKATLSR